jgi:hypothetical protein
LRRVQHILHVPDIAGPGIRAEGPEMPATLATTGNQITTIGAEPAVLLVFGAGTQVFANNQCQRLEAGEEADVVLGGDTVIVTSNRMEGTGLSLDVRAEERRYTVVGNICGGKIIVKNAPLPAPWKPLNLESVT